MFSTGLDIEGAPGVASVQDQVFVYQAQCGAEFASTAEDGWPVTNQRPVCVSLSQRPVFKC